MALTCPGLCRSLPTPTLPVLRPIKLAVAVPRCLPGGTNWQSANPRSRPSQRFVVRASGANKNDDNEADEDLPPWVRREREKTAAEATGELPFGLYLLFSSFVAIAAIGSIFEFFNKNAIAGVIQPDNPLWAPILLVFGLTGLPTAVYLFIKGVNAANAAAEAMDKVDGFRD
mmetsp:Transcript_11686/g.21062  ORF Transcript_11686/g.21062 Transcript_11686/m.21062 type:complete len:172 (-) Transcript_11686:84-599(-)|eukprot:CAMPEP_0177765514 /NCGR_PEP_ID=MMETSP0491_2-20121128/8033_1 /TAXON_ID=63592 /ORGANISM="Tetraselmis chuii, Strain PLY429" /LENGTH=171 /DNA_ID=CAMNT_0019281869 /DNA_START=119 /DNA_END=634 /DNA_ORIENTATION=-